MPTFSYNRDIPDAPNNPSVDQPKMKVNTNSIDDLIGQDHVSFGIANGGYHKVIHQITQGSNPAAIAGINQVFSKNYTPNYTGATADTQLFNITGAGGVSQLTGNDAESDGWCWMGGILVQWGIVSFAGGATHIAAGVTFKDRGPTNKGIPFPNNIFAVIPGIRIAASGTLTFSTTIAIRTISTTNFTYVFNGDTGSTSTQFPGFYWVAIGN